MEVEKMKEGPAGRNGVGKLFEGLSGRKGGITANVDRQAAALAIGLGDVTIKAREILDRQQVARFVLQPQAAGFARRNAEIGRRSQRQLRCAEIDPARQQHRLGEFLQAEGAKRVLWTRARW